jgi:CubicO group peptidase (beta-lactamase class C family)
MEKAHVPGLSLGLIKNGEVIYTRGYGYADIENSIQVESETNFYLGSLSKIATATLILQLAEEGFVSLDEDINTYLPFPVVNPHFPDSAITLRMLLSHTSTIIDDEEIYDSTYTLHANGGDSPIALYDYVYDCLATDGAWSEKTFYIEKEPGSFYEYSNLGYALIGLVAESVMNDSFSELTIERIFDPLSMNTTRWFLSELDESKIAVPYKYNNSGYTALPYYGFPSYPDGQLKSNMEDMLIFLQMFLQKGNYQGNEILSSSSIEEMLTVYNKSVNDGQALGWSWEEFNLPLFNNCYLPAKGGEDPGARTVMIFNPDTKSGLIILMNQSLENFWTEQRIMLFNLVNKLKNDLEM